MWRDQAGRDVPYVGARDLAELKKTNREKDYPVIGELARLLADPSEQLLLSRSARDIRALAERHPERMPGLVALRPLLALAGAGRQELEAALGAERRSLIRENERRLAACATTARDWTERWRVVAEEIAGLPLVEAHGMVVARALGVLPFALPEETP